MKGEKKNNIYNKDKLPIENQDNEKVKPSIDVADTIATMLIDKIISNVILNIKLKETYKKTNEHLFNNIINFINPYLNSNYILHENGIEDLEYQKKELYFCHEPIKKINTWSIIPEPACSTKDRCENTKAKVIKYKKYTDLKSDGVRESSAGLDAEEDKLKKSHNNNENKSKRLKKLILISKEKEKKQEKVVKNEPKPRINLSINNDFPKRKKDEVLELSMIDDLPKESYENKYSLINSNDENNKLRLDREIQIEKKLLMEKLAKDREIQEKKIRQKLMLMKIGKQIDGNRLTFDPDGKIINLRSQNYENFQDGFVFSNWKINTKVKKKPILTLKDVVYPVEGVEQVEDEEEKDKDKDKENNEIKIENEKNRIKVEKYEEKTKDKNDRYKKKKEKENMTIIPSGVNFDTIKPEVGVIIYGENRKNIKEGGFDYVKKYNRYSLNELSRFISESSNMNSNNNFTSIMNSKNDLNKNSKDSFNNDGVNDHLKTEDNYVGYKEEFNDNNNPLILNAHYSNNNSKNNSSDKYRYNSLNSLHSLNINKSNLISKRKLKSFDRVKTENSLEPIISIKLNKNLKSKNLTNIFDETTLNTINNNTNEKKLGNSQNANTLDNMNYFEKAVLTFKNLSYKRRYNEMKISNTLNIDKNNKEKEYSDQAFINKFNLNIMKNKEWGKNEDNYFKLQEQMNSEMMGGESQNQSIFRRQRNNYNRMKNLGMHIMTEGNTRDRKEKRFPLFGGY